MIRNLTPHPVRVYAPDTADRIDDLDAGLRTVIPPEETPARINVRSMGPSPSPAHDGVLIPTVLTEYGHITGLPNPEPRVYLVVSLVVALAARGRSDLLVPDAEVRNTDGTVVGCRRLASPC